MKNWVVTSMDGEKARIYEFETLGRAWKCFNSMCETRECVGYVAKVDMIGWKGYEHPNGDYDALFIRSLVAEPHYVKMLNLK